MSITLKEASEQVGVTRQTLMKAIKNGRVSAEKSSAGEWRIEPVELFRVWPAVKGVQHPTQVHLTGSDRAGASPVEGEVIALLKEQIDLLRSQLDDVRADREDIRADRNQWRQMAERGLLTDQRPLPEQAPIATPKIVESGEPTPPPPLPSTGGFWSRLFGRQGDSPSEH